MRRDFMGRNLELQLIPNLRSSTCTKVFKDELLSLNGHQEIRKNVDYKIIRMIIDFVCKLIA